MNILYPTIRNNYNLPAIHISLPDDCSPKPCMHGGNCTDLVADFSCSCPDNYSGRLCEDRLESICQTTATTCDNGRCMDIFHVWDALCVCQPGYRLG